MGALQSTVMCIEMLGFAIAHAFAFSYTDYPRVTELEVTAAHAPLCLRRRAMFPSPLKIFPTSGLKRPANAASGLGEVLCPCEITMEGGNVFVVAHGAQVIFLLHKAPTAYPQNKITHN